MATLQLGTFDTGKKPSDLKKFFEPYHNYGDVMKKSVQFRSDNNNVFVPWAEEGENGKIEEVQIFLEKHGFMTKRYNPGIFDYVTEASVRLFQEYMNTYEEKECERNGKVAEGSNTRKYMDAWPTGKLCEWDPGLSAGIPSKEYTDWMTLLSKAKTHFSNPDNQGPIMKAVNARADTVSTLKVEDWNFDKDKIHLIGIRRNEMLKADSGRRKNDDLFILLLNGNVFKFWGSTDPSDHQTEKDEPFLVEGQHLYSFGWHKISNSKKTYRALRPSIGEQVLCVRDVHNDGRFTIDDLLQGGLRPVGQINIHWTGVSWDDAAWSAGCQVISGKSYLNDRKKGKLNDPRNYVDCSKFAAAGYDDLTNNDQKTRGAYSFLADLVVCYSKKGVNQLYYTLGNELEQWDEVKNVFGETYVKDALRAMKAPGTN